MKKIVSFLILTFLMLALLSVGASAEILKAGQSIDAGEVTITVIDDGVDLWLCVTYVAGVDWKLVETHFAIATSLGDIPQTKKGNPIPGNFLYGDDELGEYDVDGNLVGGEDSYNECILLSELGVKVGDTVYIAAQANLLNIVDTDVDGNLLLQTETGWGDGIDFAGNNWAMYFTFTLED